MVAKCPSVAVLAPLSHSHARCVTPVSNVDGWQLSVRLDNACDQNWYRPDSLGTELNSDAHDTLIPQHYRVQPRQIHTNGFLLISSKVTPKVAETLVQQLSHHVFNFTIFLQAHFIRATQACDSRWAMHPCRDSQSPPPSARWGTPTSPEYSATVPSPVAIHP